MLGPLLGRVAIHSWRQGGTRVEFVGSSGKTNGWDASTSAKSERDGDGVWMMKALGFRREVGHVATSGLAGVPETSRGKVWRFLQNRPRTRFRQFSQNCPREDSRRARGDIWAIASGRSKLLQVVAAVGWPSSLILALRSILVFRGRLGGEERKGGQQHTNG